MACSGREWEVCAGPCTHPGPRRDTVLSCRSPVGLASQSREPRSPFPIPIAVPSAPCLVASGSGITHVLASAAVSQEVANLSSLG